MKIHCVTMTGFGPFRDSETVDFDAFADDGIFLITGRTGAGKTSILDAVTFALFGSVPRYSGQAGQAVRSDYLSPEQPCCVQVEFSTGDRRFKVTRSPAWERPKQRGTGTTMVQVKAELDELKDGTWQRLQSKVGETNKQINDLIRMNSSQFQQVVLLAQGQFQEFLVADTEKRRSLLQTLFGTKRFADYVRILTERASELRRRTDDARLSLGEKINQFASVTEADEGKPAPQPGDETVAQWCAVRVANEYDALGRAEHHQHSIQDVLTTAKKTQAHQLMIADRQQRRDRALAEQAQLKARAAAITAVKGSLQLAQRADLVAAAISTFEQARESAMKAEQAVTAAEAGLSRVQPDFPAGTVDLAESITVMNRLLGRLQPQVETEKLLPSLRGIASTADQELAGHDEQVVALRNGRDAATAESAELRKKIASLEEPAATLAEAKIRAEKAARYVEAAQRAEALATELVQARQDDLRANQKAAAASERLATLRKRQLAGYAGDLARGLADGDHCPVCGSLAHPKLAELADDHVDQADLDQAQAVVEATYTESRESAAQIQRLTERLTMQTAAAEEQTVAEATANADHARSALDAALAADQELNRCRHALTGLQEKTDAIASELDSAHRRREGLAAAVVSARATLADAEKTIAEARGDQPSVQQRAERLRLQVELSQRLLDAKQARQIAAEHVGAEQDRVTEALKQAGFVDLAEAKTATIPQQEQDRLRADVEQYEARSEAVRLTLEAADLSDLPVEPVDVKGPEAEVSRLETELQEAFRAVLTIERRLDQMRRLATQIAEQQEIVAAEARQFETVDRLASTLRGLPPNTMRMELETFVLAAQLEEIVQIANTRLRTMTDDRYTLRHSDAIETNRGKWGLGLEVLDAHAGSVRSPDSLSGGEKFQASLALALGLADVVTSRAGGMRLDTLFIDEGFGSLDAETLDITMATLDNLREGGRTVGLISHVESMQESIPAQLSVELVPGGWSVIRQEARL